MVLQGKKEQDVYDSLNLQVYVRLDSNIESKSLNNTFI